MKTKLLGLLILTVLGIFAFSQVIAFAEQLSLKGTIIDNACASANMAKLESFVKTHDKNCAIKPACEASGYSIYSGGKLYKFDAESNKRIAGFLKKADSKTQVVVKVESGKELKLISIENQK